MKLTSGDALFGIHADALRVYSQRTGVLASNIANADTPNYLAREIDFRGALDKAQAEQSTAALKTTNAGHFPGSTGGTGGAETLYRIPLQPAADGNTVDAQLEKAAFADNTVRYQATLSFLDGRIRSMMTAIKGE